MAKGKIVDYNPPTDEQLSKRKVYGGPEKASIPASEAKKGGGWYGEYARHSQVAKESWEKRRRDRITPDATKKKKIEKELMTKYNAGYMERLDAGGTALIDKDIEELSKGAKIENKYIKEDEELRRKGMKESDDVDAAKKKLERKIKEYEEKQDDDLYKQAGEERTAAQNREDLKEEFNKDISSARSIIEDYERAAGGAAAAQAQKKAREAKVEEEKKKKEEWLHAKQKTEKINKLKRDRTKLESKLGYRERKLAELERDQKKAEEEYNKEVEHLEKKPDISKEEIEKLTRSEKNRLDSVNSEVSDIKKEITDIRSEIYDVNKELTDITGVKETETKKPGETKKGTWWKDIEQKHKTKSKKERKFPEEAPPWFKGTQKDWENSKDWWKEKECKKRRGSFEDSKDLKNAPPWFEPEAKDREALWDMMTDERKKEYWKEFKSSKTSYSDEKKSKEETKRTYTYGKSGKGPRELSNRELITTYKNRYTSKTFVIPEDVWYNVGYAEHAYLDDYLDAIASGTPSDREKTLYDLRRNIKYNKK